jgi:putative OPT family oligopeptide transporter
MPGGQQLFLTEFCFHTTITAACFAYGIDPPTPEHQNSLNTRQAALIASVAKGMFGGEPPWNMIAIGGVVWAAIITVDAWLKSRNSSFRVPMLAAAIGIYLPLKFLLPIFLGGVIACLVERKHKVAAHDEAGRDRVHRQGTLFSAGLITGDALMGIATPIVLSARGDVLALPARENYLGGVARKVLVTGTTSLYSALTSWEIAQCPTPSLPLLKMNFWGIPKAFMFAS